MKTLFARSFAAFFVSLVLLVLVILAVFLFGMRRSIGDWNLYRRQSLQNIIVPSLNELARREGGLRPDSVERELSQFLNPNQYVYVFDAERRPVFLYHGGERRAIEDPAVVEELISPLEERGAMPAALFDGDVVIGFLAADTLGFMSDVANLRFLRSVTVTFLSAVILAAVVAFIPAYRISRGISNSVKELAEGLTAIGEGKRDIEFQRSGAALELSLVAETAESLQAQLEYEEKLRRQWAQDISHDLRTPLTAFRTQLEGMIEGVIEPTQTRLAAMFQELLQIEHLVRDLRELSHIESPEMRLNWSNINSESFIGLLVRRSKAAHQREDVSYVTEAKVDSFRGDEQLLLRAVDNVVQNAVVHAHDGGQIRISIEEAGPPMTTRIEVRNTGAIDVAELPHVFERLYRSEPRPNNKASTGGSGLGLSITKAIVELHGASVRMLQAADETVVDILLPTQVDNPDGSCH
jgi:two-component system, OmpR family, sensor histidine kinase BaeS